MFGIDVRSLAAFRMCIGLVMGLDTGKQLCSAHCIHPRDLYLILVVCFFLKIVLKKWDPYTHHTTNTTPPFFAVLLRMADVCAHYSDKGVLPTHVAREHMLGAGTQFSLLFINGSCGFAAGFFLFTFAVSMMLVVGYHTRLAGFLTWVCCVSIHVRNLNVLNGGDHIIRLLLFFMFLCKFFLFFLVFPSFFSLFPISRGAGGGYRVS